MKKIIKKYWFISTVLLVIIITSFIDFNKSVQILELSWQNTLTMLSLVPPIFILIGLLDVFISKELMMKHMGPDSGILGFVYALLLGGLAAGPLYMAFPIGAILLKKEAHIRYVVFFFGIWTTLKLPILLYEFANFGFAFTITNILIALIVFFIGAYLFEIILSKSEKDEIKQKATSMLDDK